MNITITMMMIRIESIAVVAWTIVATYSIVTVLFTSSTVNAAFINVFITNRNNLSNKLLIYQCSCSRYYPKYIQCYMYSCNFQHCYDSSVHILHNLLNIHWYLYKYKWDCHQLILPVQNVPDIKLYPSVQEQVKLPIVFVHICSHPPLLVIHSSISIDVMCAFKEIKITSYLYSLFHCY